MRTGSFFSCVRTGSVLSRVRTGSAGLRKHHHLQTLQRGSLVVQFSQEAGLVLDQRKDQEQLLSAEKQLHRVRTPAKIRVL